MNKKLIPKEGSTLGNLGLLADVPMKISVELGRTELLVKDILVLNKGSIIELDRIAGSPIDILVNGKLFGHGEVIVIDETFSIRVLDICDNKKMEGGE